MPEYLSPAVYVEELSSGVKPIEGIGTSTAGFIGLTEKGPIGIATPINNFSEFQKRFGGFFSHALLPFAVKSFFDEGGRSCYIVRACHFDDSGNPTATAAASTYKAVGDDQTDALLVQASSPGTWGDDIAIKILHSGVDRFGLEVFQSGQLAEPPFKNLSMDKGDKDYVQTRINGVSQLIHVEDRISETSRLSIANRRPKATEGTIPNLLLPGRDGTEELRDDDYITKGGLSAFEKVDDVNIIAIPEAVGRAVHVAGMAYCERRRDCFYIADCQPVITVADDVLNYKTADGIFAEGNAISSKYGALYAPWIEVFDPRTGGRIAIPPSGAVAGRYAAVDGTRGVHKVPAGVMDGKLSSALGLKFNFVAADQEKLNPKGINLIRSFPGTGPAIWGARTVSSDPEWRYLNIRRLFIFLRQSILEGTTWVVFEPNDRTLRKSIERNIAAFLRLQWLTGALVGTTADEAFYVRCDDETNPPESVQLGRVITEIGVAPSKPAEFVIFRIMQQQGGGSTA